MKLFDLVSEMSSTRITSISSEGLDFIKKKEGFREKVYRDKQKYAIGYGSQVDPVKYKDVVIDEPKAESMLKNFLVKEVYPAIQRVDNLRTVPLNQNQFDALCSLIYNVGYPRFEETKLRKHIINRNREGVIKEWSDWENKERRMEELSKYLGEPLDKIFPAKKTEKITPKVQSTTPKK